jgi:hypothetical protein
MSVRVKPFTTLLRTTTRPDHSRLDPDLVVQKYFKRERKVSSIKSSGEHPECLGRRFKRRSKAGWVLSYSVIPYVAFLRRGISGFGGYLKFF